MSGEWEVIAVWMVTGGAGYIGAHVVRALLADGQRVVVVDDLSDGLLARVPDGVQANIVSVLDARALAQVMTELNVSGVVHLAAKKAAGDSVRQPVYYHQQNTGGVISLLAAMEKAGVGRLVYSSSAAVYGEPVDDSPLTEEARTAPTNPYGSSKLIGEMMIRDAAGALDLSWAALRYFNVAGCGAGELSDTSANNLIPMLLRAHVAGRPGRIFGTDYATPDGTCIRDYIHVVDLAEAHVAACRLVSGDLGPRGAIDPVGATALAQESARVGATALAQESARGGATALARESARVGATDRARESAPVGSTTSAQESARVGATTSAQDSARVGATASAQESDPVGATTSAQESDPVGATDRIGATLNIGTGRGSSVREVIDSVGRALGTPLAVEEAPRRPGDPSMVQADPSGAAEVLGWRSRYTLDDMTTSAVSGLTWLSASGHL